MNDVKLSVSQIIRFIFYKPDLFKEVEKITNLKYEYFENPYYLNSKCDNYINILDYKFDYKNFYTAINCIKGMICSISLLNKEEFNKFENNCFFMVL